MLVSIELRGAYNNRRPNKKDMDKNIDALNRVINRKPALAHDTNVMLDTISILEALQKEL